MTNGTPTRADVEIVSFGFLHGPAPAAHVMIDVRQHVRDPHINPALRELTARDLRVRQNVMHTPGVRPLLAGIVAVIEAYQTGPSGLRTAPRGPVRVALGCAGGRHRAPVLGMALAAVMAGDTITAYGYGVSYLSIWQGWRIELTHRDLHKPVVRRTEGAA